MGDWFQNLCEATKGIGYIEPSTNRGGGLPPGRHQVRLLDVIAAARDDGTPYIRFSFEAVSGEHQGEQHSVFQNVISKKAEKQEKTTAMLKGWLVNLGLVEENFKADSLGQFFQKSPTGEEAHWKSPIPGSIHQIKVVAGKPYEGSDGKMRDGSDSTWYDKPISIEEVPASASGEDDSGGGEESAPDPDNGDGDGEPKAPPKGAAKPAKAAKPRKATAQATTDDDKASKPATASGKASQDGEDPKVVEARKYLKSMHGDPGRLKRPELVLQAAKALEAVQFEEDPNPADLKCLARAFSIEMDGKSTEEVVAAITKATTNGKKDSDDDQDIPF